MKKHFTGRAAGLTLWTDFREDTVSGHSLRVTLFELLVPSQMTTYNAYTTTNQKKERSFVRYVNFWCGLRKQRNGGKYGCNFFLKYFVKIGCLGKKFTHRLILCSFIYKIMYYTSGFVDKYDGGRLKTITMWQKNLRLGLRIVWVRRTPDKARWRRLKKRKQLSSKCSKSTKTKAKHTDLRNIRLICLFCQVFGYIL